MQMQVRARGLSHPRRRGHEDKAELFSTQANFAGRTGLAPSLRNAVKPFQASRLPVVVMAADRLRLHNLGPEDGSRRRELRKGRGIAAGQARDVLPHDFARAHPCSLAGPHLRIRQPRAKSPFRLRDPAWV